MASRPTAPDRMRRVLAVIPWIVANPGQPVRTVAARFGVTERELLDDLNVVYLVGLPPYSPDALIDVDIDDDGGVTIRLADFFSRPLRLTPAQGLALLASSDGLLSVPGTEPDGALARALQKLGASLGVGPDDALDVHLGDAEARVLDQLRRAAAEGTEVDITYYSYGRDERGARTVTPWRVFAEAGAWYLHAWCSQAGDERVFRVDRIEHLDPRSTPSAHPAPGADGQEGESGGAGGVAVFQPRHDDPRVRLWLSSDAAWVVDAYPAEVLERSDDGHLVAELVVTAIPWLERLLLRLGPEAEVVGEQGLPDAGELAARAANRILQRYRLG